MTTSYAKPNAIVVTLATVLWLPRLNVRKEIDKDGNVTDQPQVFDPTDPKTKDLIASLRDRGYDPQYPVIVGPISDERVKEGLQLRTEEYEGLKAIVRTHPSDENMAELAAFEYFYLVHKGKSKDKVIATPEYLGATGNQRSQSIRRAAVARLVKVKTTDPTADPFNHPELYLDGLAMTGLYEEFKDDIARTLRQLEENNAKVEGFKPLNFMENLMAVRHGIETARITQADLRRQFKDGEGQKMYGFLLTNSRFPKLDLFNRIRMAPNNPRSIAWSRLPQGGEKTWPYLLRNTNQKEHDDNNAKLAAKGKEQEPWLEEAGVEALIQEWLKGRTNAPKVMGRDKLQQLQSQNPVKFVTELMADVLENKSTAIDKVTAIAPTLNGIHALLGKPEFNSVSDIVTKISDIKDDGVRADFVKYLHVCSGVNDAGVQGNVVGVIEGKLATHVAKK